MNVVTPATLFLLDKWINPQSSLTIYARWLISFLFQSFPDLSFSFLLFCLSHWVVFLLDVATLAACWCSAIYHRSIDVPLAVAWRWIGVILRPINIAVFCRHGCWWVARISTLFPLVDAPCPQGENDWNSSEWWGLTPMWLASLTNSATWSILLVHGPCNRLWWLWLAELSM